MHCESEDQLKALARAGVNVFRLNFSHGTSENKREITARIRKLNEELGSHIAILADLQGPKIRENDVEQTEELLSMSELAANEAKASYKEV